jgi:hypothetical protein
MWLASLVSPETTNICSLKLVDTPYGPRQITLNRQLSVPKELMDRAHLRPGDQVYLQWNEQLPGTILIIPVEIIAEWIHAGREVAGFATRFPSIDPPV